MPRARWQSRKIKKRAYQRKQARGKVCPERAGEAEKTRKRHTRESKQREKYAPGAPAEWKKHEKGIPGKARRGQVFFLV